MSEHKDCKHDSMNGSDYICELESELVRVKEELKNFKSLDSLYSHILPDDLKKILQERDSLKASCEELVKALEETVNFLEMDGSRHYIWRNLIANHKKRMEEGK